MCDIFYGGGPFCPPPPHPWAAPKKPILNFVNGCICENRVCFLLQVTLDFILLCRWEKESITFSFSSRKYFNIFSRLWYIKFATSQGIGFYVLNLFWICARLNWNTNTFKEADLLVMVRLFEPWDIRPKKTFVSGNACDEKNSHPGGRKFIF